MTHADADAEADEDDEGSASVLVVVAAAVLMLVGGTFTLAASVAGARQQAATAADLAALAAAASDPRCARAAAVTEANRARLLHCTVRPDATVTVTTAVEVPLPDLFGGRRRAVVSARAGRTDVPVGNGFPLSDRAGAP